MQNLTNRNCSNVQMATTTQRERWDIRCLTDRGPVSHGPKSNVSQTTTCYWSTVDTLSQCPTINVNQTQL